MKAESGKGTGQVYPEELFQPEPPSRESQGAVLAMNAHYAGVKGGLSLNSRIPERHFCLTGYFEAVCRLCICGESHSSGTAKCQFCCSFFQAVCRLCKSGVIQLSVIICLYQFIVGLEKRPVNQLCKK